MLSLECRRDMHEDCDDDECNCWCHQEEAPFL